MISNKNITRLKKETTERKNAIRQLKDLLYELDTLRAQVEDSSLDKFDNQTFALRKNIAALIKDYVGKNCNGSFYLYILNTQFVALERTASQVIKENEEPEEEEPSNPFEGINQIQMQESIQQIKLNAETERLNRIENLNENIHDIHGMYETLNNMVQEQKENVHIIEDNVEQTQEEVNEGVKTIVKICKQVILYMLSAYSMVQ